MGGGGGWGEIERESRQSAWQASQSYQLTTSLEGGFCMQACYHGRPWSAQGGAGLEGPQGTYVYTLKSERRVGQCSYSHESLRPLIFEAMAMHSFRVVLVNCMITSEQPLRATTTRPLRTSALNSRGATKIL